MSQQFGGNWTIQKLNALRDYLRAWETIFTRNSRAQNFYRLYVDGFAGSGKIEIVDPELSYYVDGSVGVALEFDFHQYWFIDNNQSNIDSLYKLRDKSNKKDRVNIFQSDANEFISSWCERVDWQRNRAIVFLDPFGMQVKWETIKKLKSTNGVDLWLLFPIGMGVMRMLKNNGELPKSWVDRLNTFFGSDDWKNEFYKVEDDLFGNTVNVKTATFEKIKNYSIRRLKSLFGENAVAKPLELYNDNGTLLYLLFFVASNEKGARTAVRIASHILGKNQ